MDLEVNSRYDSACETFLLIDPARHQVLHHDWPWLRWCRSVAPRESRLGIYRHRETGRFVLGNWVYDETEALNPVIMEMESFSGDPTDIWPSDLLCPALMNFRLRPSEEHLERLRRQAHDKRVRERAEREERIDYRLSRARYLKQQGMEEAAEAMRIGQTPLAKPTSDRRDMWVDLLKSARRAS